MEVGISEKLGVLRPVNQYGYIRARGRLKRKRKTEKHKLSFSNSL